jgi:hypothetical protein
MERSLVKVAEIVASRSEPPTVIGDPSQTLADRRGHRM